jgi:hypothetical protein
LPSNNGIQPDDFCFGCLEPRQAKRKDEKTNTKK